MSTEKLPIEFKKKWVDALRSGDYEQGQGLLRDYQDKYCCLGVAADVAGCKNFRGVASINPNVGIRGIRGVPKVIVGSTLENHTAFSLASLNDNGVPFEVIAGVINEWL